MEQLERCGTSGVRPVVVCRRMEEQDLEIVERLEKGSFSDAWSMTLLRAGLSSRWDTFFVAECQGQVCGYGALRVLAGEGEIQRIAVFPEYRRLGIGRELMEAMVAFSCEQGAPEMTLEVRSGNVAAIGLYKSYGFVEEGLRKGYYHNPTEDALIMWRHGV